MRQPYLNFIHISQSSHFVISNHCWIWIVSNWNMCNHDEVWPCPMVTQNTNTNFKWNLFEREEEEEKRCGEKDEDDNEKKINENEKTSRTGFLLIFTLSKSLSALCISMNFDAAHTRNSIAFFMVDLRLFTLFWTVLSSLLFDGFLKLKFNALISILCACVMVHHFKSNQFNSIQFWTDHKFDVEHFFIAVAKALREKQ